MIEFLIKASRDIEIAHISSHIPTKISSLMDYYAKILKHLIICRLEGKNLLKFILFNLTS